MTIHSPEAEEQPPLSANGSSATTATTARSGRGSDYRLRGLDLDAPALAEAQSRPERRRHPNVRRRRRRLFVQWIVALLVIATVAVLLRTYVVQPFSVSSTSMVPTLQAGTEVLVVKSSHLHAPIKAGDIIVFHEPQGARCSSTGTARHLIKRVIGVPGETIWSVGGSIYVDGRRLKEPGWYNPPFGEVGPTKIARTRIPRGRYFVMGDNRTDTCDSRSFGPITGSSLIGKVVATIARDGHPFVHSM